MLKDFYLFIYTRGIERSCLQVCLVWLPEVRNLRQSMNYTFEHLSQTDCASNLRY